MTSAERLDVLRPGDRPLRAVRSTAAALVCVTAAAVGHQAAGGTLPTAAVVGAFAGSVAVAWSLSARRLTTSQLLGLLALCQVVVHLTTSSADMAMGAGMLAAHAAATVVSVVLLARGEHFVWQLAHRLGLRALPLLRATSTATSPRPPLAMVSGVPRSLRDVRLAHSRSLRGPPVSLV